MVFLSITVSQGLLALGVVVLGLLSWELFFSPLRAFGGPFLAKFTDIWRAFWTALGNIDTTHRQWHDKYGMAVRIGPNCISIGDPSLIRTIYATKVAWQKSDMYRPNDALINRERVHNLFNTQDNAWHDKNLKPIRGFWTMTKVLEIEPLIDQTLNLLTSKIDVNFASKSQNDKKVCMIDDWLSYFAWDATANICFGQHYGFLDQEKDIDNLILDSTKGLYYYAPISQMPWVDLLLDKNPIMRIGPKPALAGIFYAFKVVAQYQASLASGGGVGKTGELVCWFMLNVLAGGDTTSATMRAVVYYLAKAPEAYKKLTSELDAAQLSLPGQWKDIKALPYLDAVLREAIRMNPAIAMVFKRVVPKTSFTLPDGRFLPAGTTVGINPAVTNHNREIFGADADEFNPDRWLTEDKESLKRMRDTADFTFGAGSRVCMGCSFAQLELYKLFGTLYSMYDIHLVDPKHEWKYHNAWFVYQWDMPMHITRRSS